MIPKINSLSLLNYVYRCACVHVHTYLRVSVEDSSKNIEYIFGNIKLEFHTWINYLYFNPQCLYLYIHISFSQTLLPRSLSDKYFINFQLRPCEGYRCIIKWLFSHKMSDILCILGRKTCIWKIVP